MSDLPESLQRARHAALAQAFLNQPFEANTEAAQEGGEALRTQQYLAAQSYHIRIALDRIAGMIHHMEERSDKSLFRSAD